MTKPSIATGISYGAHPDARLASNAIRMAISKLDNTAIGSVLLYLSPGFAFAPSEALREAAKTAGTPQIYGCCSNGVFTEDEWAIDAEAAVAMVFPVGQGPQPYEIAKRSGSNPNACLSICSPNALDIAINTHSAPTLGGVCSDEYGHGPFTIWQAGKVIEQERSHLSFGKHDLLPLRADSLEFLSEPQQLNKAKHFELEQIELMPAARNLLQAIEAHGGQEIMCVISNHREQESIQQGSFEMHHVVHFDEQKVTLSGSVKAGRYIRWAMRTPQAAITSLESSLNLLSKTTNNQADFVLAFNNLSRGPEFFTHCELDLETLKKHFENTPIVGFYSNAEIHPGLNGYGVAHHHSIELGLGLHA